ncbi:sigma-54 dependent transcriptional regulator [soil metagenome]
MPSVLIVDDEPNIRRMVGALLSAEGYEVREAEDGTKGLASADQEEPDVVLLDLLMPGALDGMATLTRLREKHPDIPVVMMSGKAGLGDAVRATRLGALNFLAKPMTPESVLLTADAAAELRRTRLAARALREELGIGGRMIGSSPEMRTVAELIERIAPTDSRVLITCESGTGKELVAAAIHDASRRRDRAFIRVNCAAIPRDLVESEMFGHDRGAFTGATQTRIGRFELAHGGTLFLDEIGDLGAEAQAKLLRAIEAKEIQRVGGSKPVHVDVRIISATNHNLARGVADGVFREDLFFRLNVIPLTLPPLRERNGDAVELARYFTELHHSRTGHPRVTWTEDALAAIAEYPWPGNVRELANIVERMGILYPGEELTRAHLLAVLPRTAAGDEPARLPAGDVPLAESLDDFERRLIARALDASRWNIADAARRLQTDRPNLYRRMKRLGIDDPRV